MAFSSTSSIHKSFKYDVFLSFRGEDTRSNFVDHLYHALQQKSIHTYKDDERIKKGKRISDELIGSIEDSKFYIIVFSKNYASSSWCLDELVKIMECHRTTDHTAYPIFYDVEPSEVRKQKGAVEEAFSKHEKDATAEKWREALKEASDLAGWELKKTADGHEAKFIQKIVEELSLELRSIRFNIDEKLVGMQSRIKEVVSSVGTDFDDVRMIGIKGMGGGGKTTLARAVFDHISFQFEGKSFIENVREVSNASLSGLKSLQNQVLSDVLNDKDINVSSVYEGRHMMNRMLRDKKVLVVLDDVDHIDQLEALAGELDWFKKGSRIIITTRDEQVLVSHHVKLIHGVNLLSDKEAISLFHRYAFGKKIPVQEYEELSRQVVRYAAGLPLTIKVLGSFLCGKDELEWIDAIERLKSIPLTETLKKLELSYIGLDEDYKEMFLDVACVLKGWKKDMAIKALECCGFHARNGLKVLEQKSLVTISSSYDHYEYVGMHDHIEEMGRNIVRRLHPDKPHKHSRLWKIDEIEDILANDLGTKATRSILLHNYKVNQNFVIEGLRKMKELRFLSFQVSRFSNLKFNIVSPEFPNSLRYLRWDGYPCRSLPTTFQANNLVALEMVGSKIIQLWEGGEGKVLNKLRFLDLSRSMLSTLDLRLTPNLEKLDLEYCLNLVELHMPIACLKLMYVNLKGSGSIRTIDLRLAPNLEELILNFCKDLEKLQMPDRCLNLRSLLVTNSKLRTLDIGLNPNLRKLDPTCCHYLEELNMAYACQKLTNLNISHTKLRTLDLGLTPNLETLNIQLCTYLVELHMHVEYLKLIHVELKCSSLRTLDLGLAPNLEELYLVECNNLEKLQMPDRCLNLRLLLVTNSKLRTLNIGQTPNLRKLEIKNSYYLEELDMADECLMLANIDISHSKLRTLDLRLTPNLETLFLDNSCHLVQLLLPIGGLKKLLSLHLNSLRFRSFSFRIKDYTSCGVDESLEIVGPLAELYLAAKSPVSCPLHPNNSLPKFQFICDYIEDRPSLTGNLEMLLSLGICTSSNLERFTESICGLRRLRKLELAGHILEVPKDIHKLKCLEELKLSSTEIKHLPDSICMLKHLKSLQLISCWLLEKLPEELGRLECLKLLNILGTRISHFPQSILLLKGLRVDGSRELLELCGFTFEIQTSEDHYTICYI